MSDALESIIVLPLVLIVVVAIDYVAWDVFQAIAGGFAILWMVLLLLLEGALLLNLVRDS